MPDGERENSTSRFKCQKETEERSRSEVLKARSKMGVPSSLTFQMFLWWQFHHTQTNMGIDVWVTTPAGWPSPHSPLRPGCVAAAFFPLGSSPLLASRLPGLCPALSYFPNTLPTSLQTCSSLRSRQIILT